MKCKLETFYKRQDRHGNSLACLRLDLVTANTDYRDRVATAIRKAMADPEPEPVEKSSALGFHCSGSEDQ